MNMMGGQQMEVPQNLDRRLSSEQLKEALMDVAHNLRINGVPVKDDCRVDMNVFVGTVYNKEKVQIHLDNLERREKLWDKQKERPQDPRRLNWRSSSLEEEKRSDNSLQQNGDKLEALIAIVLYHMLNEHFYILRTSRHDDTKNGIDTLIVDKITGNVVGAFDEVVDDQGGRLHEKVEKILQRNFMGGGLIHYGIEVKDGKVVPSGLQENIPIFHLALTEDELDRGLAQLNDGMSPEYEKWLLSRFLISTGSQIDQLRERESELDPKLKERLTLFAEKLAKVEQNLS